MGRKGNAQNASTPTASHFTPHQFPIHLPSPMSSGVTHRVGVGILPKRRTTCTCWLHSAEPPIYGLLIYGFISGRWVREQHFLNVGNPSFLRIPFCYLHSPQFTAVFQWYSKHAFRSVTCFLPHISLCICPTAYDIRLNRFLERFPSSLERIK